MMAKGERQMVEREKEKVGRGKKERGIGTEVETPTILDSITTVVL
jgi:hypothetical protein